MSAQLTSRPPVAKADVREQRLAFTAAFAALAAAATTPLGTRVIGENPSFVAATCSAALVAMAVIAAIFFNQYRTSRRAPLAFLATVYALGAAVQIPIALAAPHVLSTTHASAPPAISTYLWVVWHGLFVFGLGGYVWAESYFERQDVEPARAMRIVRRYAGVAIPLSLGAIALTVAHAHAFPALVSGAAYTPVFRIVVEQLLLAATAIVLVTHIALGGLRHLFGVWIGVVLVAIGIETYVAAEVVREPYSVAWYTAGVLALFWQVLPLAVLLRQSSDQISAIAATAKVLYEETQRDSLTGLLNRRGFDRRLSEALMIAGAASQPVAMLALDLDDFKLYNDHFGHSAGDDALRAIGGALAAVVNRPGDVACRTGGEEFAIVLPFTDQAGAQVVAERVREKVLHLRLPHAPGASHAVMTLSIGVAASEPGQPISPHVLYERADQALYRSKRRGRNRITPFAKSRDGNLRYG